jgi:hypothetical protein
MHEIHGLAFLQSEEGLDVAAAEERNGFGRTRLGQDARKFMDIRRVCDFPPLLRLVPAIVRLNRNCRD